MLIQEGVTQRDPLSILIYRITFVPLAEKLRSEDPGLLNMLYADDAAFYESTPRISQILKLLMGRGEDRDYFHRDSQVAVYFGFTRSGGSGKKDFFTEEINLKIVDDSWYLGAYLGPQEELETWVKPKEELWAHGVKV